jgi:hypothetical protein
MRDRRRSLHAGCAVAIGALCWISSTETLSRAADLERIWRQPIASWDACLVQAAEEYDVNPLLLRAIIEVESGGDPWAVHRNGPAQRVQRPRSWSEAAHTIRDAERRRQSIDIGLMQINIQHPRRHQVDPLWLLDPCVNLRWGAWYVRTLADRYGESWEAVMRYNGRRPSYAWQIRDAWHRLQRELTDAWPTP